MTQKCADQQAGPRDSGIEPWRRQHAASIHTQARHSGFRGQPSRERSIAHFAGTWRWWARQDSNLQPSGYEPLALTIELRAPGKRS
jgi:hypothetical protein